jgi:hypothetical protein
MKKVEGGRECCGCPRQQSQTGNKFGFKMTIFNERFDFMHSAHFKLLNKSTFNKRHFVKFVITVSGHRDYWPQAPKNLAMPLHGTLSKD